MAGVAAVQFSQQSDSSMQSNVGGFFIVFAMCLSSGFACVYMELLLKSTEASLWMRNVQLSVIGVCFSLSSCYVRDGAAIAARGFFIGYTFAVWSTIVLMAIGGLTVAVVMKYADNILKIFATSASLLLVSLVSAEIFQDLVITPAYVAGAGAVLLSVYLYSAKEGLSGKACASCLSKASEV